MSEKAEAKLATSSDVPYTSALHQLLSPDGYYTYLNIPCPHLSNLKQNSSNATSKDNTESDSVDTDLVKKNYRRLSLKHHPDRRGGDPETFRVLNRAKKVLTSPTLRKQYDLIGLDLIDEEENDTNDDNETSSHQDGEGSNENSEGSGSSATLMSQLASVTLASILQVAVRTALMAIVATFITRFRITLIPMILFLCFVAYRVKNTAGTTNKDFFVPLLLIVGVSTMYYGRATIPSSDSTSITSSTWLFFFGEMLTINVFLQTSLPTQSATSNIPTNSLTLIAAFIMALILKGRFWRYAFIVGIEGLLAIITVLIFPIMEMILEELINEKLKKVGEKVRSHTKRMEAEMKRNARVS